LMQPTADGFGLMLKSGEQLGFEGVTFAGARPLRARFSYNRSFVRIATRTAAGSWTERMRPDYTLSLWPADFLEQEAEAQELMVHVHFDAKYRIDSIEQLFGLDDEKMDATGVLADLADEKREQRLGRYKRADLLKMHAYRDAIRRTQGAYVLYPGDLSQRWQGFHEILPGLGAFPIKPGNGDATLAQFIRDVVMHACDRATARERQSYHLYQVQEAPALYEVLHKLPEKDAVHRRAPPLAETHVLIGWYKDKAHLDWVLNSKLYNFRMDVERGSLRLKPEVSGAAYLLLHSHRGTTSPRVQIRSATLNNRWGGRDVRAFEPLDRQVKVAWNDLHTSHPRRTLSDCHPYQGRTWPKRDCRVDEAAPIHHQP
jgi:PD-(D/E)XK nuclease superfamily